MANDNNTVYQHIDKRFNEQNALLTTLLSFQKPILNFEEACIFTGFSKSFMYKLTSKGEVPFYKRGKHIFMDRQELEDWLKENPGFNKKKIISQASTYNATNGR